MTWEEFDNEIGLLALKIHSSPDVIIGIVRGGMIPARLLSTKLNVQSMHAVTIKKKDNERKVTNEILENLGGKKVLLVEDMLETGKSLLIAKNYLETKGASVQTACLYIMPITELKPDYYLKEVNEVIKFPWE